MPGTSEIRLNPLYAIRSRAACEMTGESRCSMPRSVVVALRGAMHSEQDGIRTHTSRGLRILSPPRLPFRHLPKLFPT